MATMPVQATYANMEAHQHSFGVKSKTNIPYSKLHSQINQISQEISVCLATIVNSLSITLSIYSLVHLKYNVTYSLGVWKPHEEQVLITEGVN